MKDEWQKNSDMEQILALMKLITIPCLGVKGNDK
jgi:hypothetical protein